MAHKAHGRGSYRIDRRFADVGRVEAPSRLYVEADFNQLNDVILPLLEEKHRQDLLIALRDRVLYADEIFRAYRQGGLKGLPTVEHVKPLEEAVAEWLARRRRAEDERPLAARTSRDYEDAFNRLLALSPAPDVSVAALPGLLRRYRERCRGGRSFNKARAAARSFASGLTGRYNPLWVELTNIGTRPVRHRESHPQTPSAARAAATTLGPKHGPMWWTRCCTGMSGGPEGPYFLDAYDVLDDRIRIHGTKTEGRARVVPRLTTPVRARTEYQAHRRALAKLGLAPNDARKTFAHWLEEAGIRRTVRRRLLGHGRRDVTDIYEDFPVETQMAEIDAKLRAYIGKDWIPALEVVG